MPTHYSNGPRKQVSPPSQLKGSAAALHRHADGNAAAFAQRFIAGRLVGFNKDLKICLTGLKLNAQSEPTHAYFPALAACCATLEYLTALYRGNTHGIGWQQVNTFASVYLPQPDFNADAVRVLFDALRHPVAHRGIASGVWVDRTQGAHNGRRLVWKITADARKPACEILAEPGKLTRDPPWPTPYSHRVHVRLRRLWIDLRNAAERYSEDIARDPTLLANFEACMRQLYPR
jgi:hypothetical protein